MSNTTKKPLRENKTGCVNKPSSCITWSGPDIPEIEICRGDSVTEAIYNLANLYVSLKEVLDTSNYDYQCLTDEVECSKDFSTLIQDMIDRICEFKTTTESQYKYINTVVSQGDVSVNVTTFPAFAFIGAGNYSNQSFTNLEPGVYKATLDMFVSDIDTGAQFTIGISGGTQPPSVGSATGVVKPSLSGFQSHSLVFILTSTDTTASIKLLGDPTGKEAKITSLKTTLEKIA